MQAQGMQGWRRFTFFDCDDAAAAAAPDALAACGLAATSCVASAGSWLAFGKSDGSVTLLDTGSQAVAAFRAHATAVQHLVVLPVLSSSTPSPNHSIWSLRCSVLCSAILLQATV